MKMNHFWIVIWLPLCLLSSGAVSQKMEMPSSPGKCYAKLEIFLYETLVVNEYTGELSGAEFSFAKKVNIEISPERTELKLVKTDNCRSPDDCLMYSKVAVPKESLTLWVVEDTSLTKKYIRRNVIQMVGNEFDWREILCDREITPNLIQDIKMMLASKDYYAGNIDDKFNDVLRVSIMKYQEDYGLPRGGLTIEFIEHLRWED